MLKIINYLVSLIEIFFLYFSSQLDSIYGTVQLMSDLLWHDITTEGN